MGVRASCIVHNSFCVAKAMRVQDARSQRRSETGLSSWSMAKAEMSDFKEPWTARDTARNVRNFLLAAASCLALYVSYSVLAQRMLVMCMSGHPDLSIKDRQCPVITPTSTVPQYFQTSPELWAGPTATGAAPFLAQTNPVSFPPTGVFVPNTPLETAGPIVGQDGNETIFRLMGKLSPYAPNIDGFGVAEYPLPPGAQISQVQVGFCNGLGDRFGLYTM